MTVANRQTSAGTSSSRRSGRTAGKGKGQGQSSTGARDEQYDVVSVLYHALKGAETVSRYIDDAREAEDEELVDFLTETKDEYAARAEKAKRILASRLEAGSTEEEEEEEEDEEEEDEEDEDED